MREQLSGYAMASRIGVSGHGELWRSERVADHLPVTIQILPVGETSFGAVRVAHAGLARVLDCGVTATGKPYLVLASLEGESLAARLRQLGPLTDAQVANVAHQVATALDALHGAGLVHRCLTTAALWLVGDQVIVLDAGLVTEGGAYAAPELADPAATVDGRADIYALGCVAFELASGHPPVPGAPPALAELGPGFSPTIGKLIARMCDQDPAQRPRQALELARVLALLAGGENAPALGTTVGVRG